MKRTRTVMLGSVAAAISAVMAATGANGSPQASTGSRVLEFGTMAAVTGPFVGAANPIRGIAGGGLPWQISAAKGELSTAGKLEVQVSGLVLFEGAPVPVDRPGTKPIAAFRAIVSCLSITDGAATTVNVATDPVPATSTGDATIEADISLPSPCIAPIVFVGPSATTWFAATGTG
jgi:hypothetical protein